MSISNKKIRLMSKVNLLPLGNGKRKAFGFSKKCKPNPRNSSKFFPFQKRQNALISTFLETKIRRFGLFFLKNSPNRSPKHLNERHRTLANYQ